MEPLYKKLTSRKFLSALIVSVTIFLNSFGVTNLETAELFTLSATVTAFIFGESILDRERIKAAQLANLEKAEGAVKAVVAQANEIMAQKDAQIVALSQIAGVVEDEGDAEVT